MNKGNDDEAAKAKLEKQLDQAAKEQAEQEAYRQARAGARKGEPDTVRKAWDKKSGTK